MKIRLSELRRLVRQALVTEKAKSIDSKQVGKLALAKVTRDGLRVFMLYDPNKMLRAIKQDGDLAESVQGVVMVDMSPSNPQWGAKEIEFSAANQGFGPLLYDIAMADVGGLTPDRETVSRAASDVWLYYKDKRPDVEKKQLDDVENPQTRIKKDDGIRYSAELGDHLDQAYFIDHAPNTSALLANHRNALPLLKKAAKEAEHYVQFDLVDIAQEFCNMHYGREEIY